MCLIHVPAGEDARFFPKRANQSGVAFEVHHTDFSLARQTQILSRSVHDHSEPLSISSVPEHQKAGILGKKTLALNAVGVRQIGG